MHSEEKIVCDICGQTVARITRSGFFNRPKRSVVNAYVTLTATETFHPSCWGMEADATDYDMHLCSWCFQSVKMQVELDKRKENKDEPQTNN